MPSAHKKTCQLIIETENHYLGALKGNQGNLLKTVKANFVAEANYTEISKGCEMSTILSGWRQLLVESRYRISTVAERQLWGEAKG